MPTARAVCMGCNPASVALHKGHNMNYRNGYNMVSLGGMTVYELDVEEITLEGGVEGQREVMRDAGCALREILEG